MLKIAIIAKRNILFVVAYLACPSFLEQGQIRFHLVWSWKHTGLWQKALKNISVVPWIWINTVYAFSVPIRFSWPVLINRFLSVLQVAIWSQLQGIPSLQMGVCQAPFWIVSSENYIVSWLQIISVYLPVPTMTWLRGKVTRNRLAETECFIWSPPSSHDIGHVCWGSL